MSSNPIKIFAFAGLAAVIAGGFLGQGLDDRDGRPQEFGGGERQAGAQLAPRAASAEPTQRKSSGFGQVALAPDRAGHFRALVEIEGQTIPMLVDTGASVVALRYEDAALLGIRPAPSDFVVSISTANGGIKAAPVRLREARLENIVAPDVRAVVMPQGALGQSLLGMSFLSKLSGFEISGGQLVMKP